MAVTSFIRFLTSLMLLSVAVQASLICKAFKPKGSSSNRGMINFSGTNGGFIVTPGNASVGNPVKLDPAHLEGNQFLFQTCNSTDLGLFTYQYYGNCEDDSCLRTYTDFVRVLNPVSGNCLTSRAVPNTNFRELFFKKCIANPTTDDSQIFVTQQQVQEPSSIDPGTYYYPCGFFPRGGPQSSPNFFFKYWQLKADRKTIVYDVVNKQVTDVAAYINQ